MHDLVIRGGSLIDGTGAPAQAGDIAIDQGGCIETIRPTSHEKPTYKEHDVIHYAVPNMPALVGRTSTLGLTQATEPYVVTIVSRGLERALARLPTEHREILLLREIEEMSYEDIAAVLEISLGTVKSRIARARAGLLEKMPR